ncbi:MAG: TerB family tellurite resistance protein [Spirochaetes bacterium]|nr:TerB family tellurite resistance protein [Spirochaetota bacterium]
MNIEKSILDIFAMTIAVDGRIDESELAVANEILEEMKYDFNENSRAYLAESSAAGDDVLKENFHYAVKELNSLESEDKKYILKYILRLVDADNIVHQNEVKLIGSIIDSWGVK